MSISIMIHHETRWNTTKPNFWIPLKDRRVNIRLSPGDLSDIQIKALEEGMPYQTLIGSVLHKYVTGRLTEGPVTRGGPPQKRQAPKRSG